LQAASNFEERYGSTLNFTGPIQQWTESAEPAANTGDPLADLEIGDIGGGSIEAGYSAFQSSKYAAFYFQDDIRATSKLTLNLGIRYDFTTPFVERRNNIYYFVPTLANPWEISLGLTPAGRLSNQYLPPSEQRHSWDRKNLPTPPAPGPKDFAHRRDQLFATPGIRLLLYERCSYPRWLGKTLHAQSFGSRRRSAGNGPFSATTPIVASVDGINPNVTLANPYPNGLSHLRALPRDSFPGGLSGLIPVEMRGTSFFVSMEL